MAKENPNYYAIIPSFVRYDKDLTANEKLMYGEITALSNKDGFCWSKNKYFANLYDVTTQTVSRWLKHLEDKEYIHREIIRNEKNQIIKRKIFITPINKNVNTSTQKCLDPINKNVKGNITSNNTTRNNKQISKYADEISAVYNHWIELLSDVNEAQLTKRQKKTILTKLKKWSVKKLKQSISNYNEMYRSDYYYSHNFTMYKFIKQSNGAPRFLPGLDDKYDGDLWKDYKNSNNKQSTNDPLAGFK